MSVLGFVRGIDQQERENRVSRSLGNRVAVGLIVAAAIIVASASSAALAEPVPAQGPTSGGTVVGDSLPGLTFSTVDAGTRSGYAIGLDDQLYSWGENSVGQLGDGTTVNRLRLTAVLPPVGAAPTFAFTAVSTGSLTTYGLGNDGQWYGWGYNWAGQVGDGTLTTRTRPVPVLNPDGVGADFAFTQLTGSQSTGYGLGNDGHLYAWGFNNYGQLGDGTQTDSPIPIRVLDPLGAPTGFTFTDVTVGYDSAYALGSNGVWYAWGYGSSGQIGNGMLTSQSRAVPMLPPSGAPVGFAFTSVYAAGGFAAHGLGNDGMLYSWGTGTYGQLGNGSTSSTSLPVAVLAPAGVPSTFRYTEMFPGNANNYALGNDGRLYSWGLNVSGQLGDGTAVNRLVPTLVSSPPDAPPGFSFSQVSAGRGTAVALGSDGHIYTWGENDAGQVGDNTSTNRWTPVPVFSDSTLTEVTFGGVPSPQMTQNADGWSVETPPRTELNGLCGPVDVTLSWTQYQRPHSETIADGFTYGSAPSVLTQPASATIPVGGAFTTGVEIEGDTPPTVQWQQETEPGVWEDIPAESGESFTASGVMETTNYRVVGTNCWGADAAAVSEVVTATVLPLTVTTDPVDQTVVVGSDAVFSAAASGIEPVTVQWQVSSDGGATFADIEAATDTTLTISSTVLAQNGTQYRALFTDAGDQVVTAGPALLTVNPVPVAVTVNPAASSVTAGEAASFTVGASGSEPISVQWQVSADGGATWEDILGATEFTYSTGATALSDDGHLFRAVLTGPGAANTAVSASARLTVAELPPTPTPSPTISTPSPTISAPQQGRLSSGDLSLTGVGLPPVVLGAGLLSVLLGCGLLAAVRRRSRAARE